MGSLLKSSQVESREVTIFLPYMKEGYHYFKIYEALYLDKICTYLNNEGIKINLINPNEHYGAEIGKGMELIKKLTDYFSDKQELMKRCINGDENLHVRKIAEKLIGMLKLSDNQVVLYYQPHFKENLYTYLFILKEMKRNLRNITLICDGIYFYATSGALLKQYDFIDYISSKSRGDFLAKTAKGTDKKKIKGITYQKDGKMVRNPDYVLDLNREPMTDHFFITKHPRIVPIEYSVGCPYSCFFCANKGLQETYQIKNIDLLLKEIEFLYERGVRYYWFLGAAINIEEPRLRDFCKTIMKRNLKIKWAAPLIPSDLEKSTYDLLHNAGCMHLRMGIETVNENILRSFGKDVTLRSIENTLRLSCEANIKNTLTFMIGLPQEKEADYIRRRVFIKKHRKLINSVQLFIFQVRVGAPIYKVALKFDLEIRNKKDNDQRYMEYDEINGLSWEDIYRKQKSMLDEGKLFLEKNDIPHISPEEYFIKLVNAHA